MKMWTLIHRKKWLGPSICVVERGRDSKAEAEDQPVPTPREVDISHYSLNAGILPPLGNIARTTRRVKLRRFIISPFDPRYRFILLSFIIIWFRFCGLLGERWLIDSLIHDPLLLLWVEGTCHRTYHMCFYWICVIFHVMFAWWLKYCRLWETYLVLLVFYTAWVSPFEFGFLEQKINGPLAITDNVVNGFFAIDIVLTFFVAYLEKTSYLLIDNPKQIAWRYTRTWLAFDVISTIPSELARRILPSSLQAYGYFNLLRLWRLRRVSKMFSR